MGLISHLSGKSTGRTSRKSPRSFRSTALGIGGSREYKDNFKKVHDRMWRQHTREKADNRNYYKEKGAWERDPTMRRELKRLEKDARRSVMGHNERKLRKYDPEYYEKAEKQVERMVRDEKRHLREDYKRQNERAMNRQYRKQIGDARKSPEVYLENKDFKSRRKGLFGWGILGL